MINILKGQKIIHKNINEINENKSNNINNDNNMEDK